MDISLKEYLAIAHFFIKKFGWTPKAIIGEDEILPTTELIRSYVNSSEKEKYLMFRGVIITHEDKKFAKDIINFYKILESKNKISQYEYDLLIVVGNDTVKEEHFGIIASSISYYWKYLEKEKKRIELESKLPWKIGSRVTFRATLESITPYDSKYGISYRYAFLDNNGYNLTWFTLKVIDLTLHKKYKMKATVKKIDTFNEIYYITISRVMSVIKL